AHVVLDADDRGEVIAEVALPHERLEEVAVEDRALDVAEALLPEVVADLVVGRDVERRDLVPARQERVRQMRADEPGAAGDQDPHVVPPTAAGMAASSIRNQPSVDATNSLPPTR